jgi:uncharacterized protein YhfF
MYWRKSHEELLTRNFRENAFDERMLLVCERFKLAYIRAEAKVNN